MTSETALLTNIMTMLAESGRATRRHIESYNRTVELLLDTVHTGESGSKRRSALERVSTRLIAEQRLRAGAEHEPTTTMDRDSEVDELREMLREERADNERLRRENERLKEVDAVQRLELHHFNAQRFAIIRFLEVEAAAKREMMRANHHLEVDLRWRRETIRRLKAGLERQSGVHPWKECEICRFEFGEQPPQRVPRVLHCGHTVCEGCAAGIHAAGAVLCPFDRQLTQCKRVTDLPRNFIVFHM